MALQHPIREPEVARTSKGEISSVRFAFGPHYFIEVEQQGDRVSCALGCTHHGIKADASEVMGELERFVEELKAPHPQNAF